MKRRRGKVFAWGGSLALLALVGAVGAHLWRPGTRGAGRVDGGTDPRAERELDSPNERLAGGTAPDAGRREAATTSETASAAEEGLAPEVRFEVAFADGRPAADHRLVVSDGDGVLAAGRTDALGRVELELARRRVDLTVLRGSAVLHAATRIEVAGASHRVVVPGTSAVAGVVRVGGAVPEEPLVVRLRSSDERGGAGDPSPAVAEHFGWRGLGGRPLLTARTDASGRFEVRGLTEAWSGELRVPSGHRLRDGATRLELPAPRDDLVLELVREPTLVGRVVDDAGAPVAGAKLRYHVACASGSETRSIAADADGRFRIPLRCGATNTVELDAREDGVGGGFWSFDDVARPAWGEVHDVGDLALTPARHLLVTVHDAAGTPIEGALVRPARPEAPPGRPTGAEGTTELEVPVDCADLYVDALGFLPAEASVTGTSVHVRLEPGSNLRVSHPSAARLVVRADGPLFAVGEGLAPDERQEELGATPAWSRRATKQGDGRVELRLELPFTRDGAVLMTNLRPGARLSLRAGSDAAEVVAPDHGWRTVALGE